MSGRKALRKESNVTFEVTVDGGAYADSTVIKDNSKQGLLGEDDDSDPPVVFLCGSCKLPVGDSLSWAGSEDEQSQILLKRVSDNVLIGKETHISGTRKKDLGCLIVHLTCCGCSSLLGLVYISTPRKLDYIRSLFCLDVAAIESQQVAAVSPKLQPVTLEYRQAVERQLDEIKAVTLSMGQRLLVLEGDQQSRSQM
ncbi:protein Mis18-alpha isoform X2 [Salvelinus fontinalis]|uniref:protein Mis18-alpha isoform X2 n=1 Tax=Salvelinus fontinalis TaxID=8038 RepID=UPI0024864FDD|nr:protein Mis18-alpha isoform X2 [Salvelinus fontinalis]